MYDLNYYLLLLRLWTVLFRRILKIDGHQSWILFIGIYTLNLINFNLGHFWDILSQHNLLYYQIVFHLYGLHIQVTGRDMHIEEAVHFLKLICEQLDPRCLCQRMQWLEHFIIIDGLLRGLESILRIWWRSLWIFFCRYIWN